MAPRLKLLVGFRNDIERDLRATTTLPG